MTAFFCRFSGMPPNLVTSDFLPGLSMVAWKQTRGPCGVVMVARNLRAIAVTVERCLAAGVLSSEVSAVQRSRVSRKTSLASR
jgi:hypothetical protein